MSATSRVAGVDGFNGGWVAVIRDLAVDAGNSAAAYRFCVAGSFSDLMSKLDERDVDVVGIDVPIGLLDEARAGGRPVDQTARILAKSPSSVFPAPIRPVIDYVREHGSAATVEEARRISQANSPSHPISLSSQAFNIAPKIAEVDAWVRANDPEQEHVFEVHPEVCFTAMTMDAHAEAPPKKLAGDKKSSASGRRARLDRLCARAGVPEALLSAGDDDLLTDLRKRAVAASPFTYGAVKADDLIDAFAAAWSAARIARRRDADAGVLRLFVPDVPQRFAAQQRSALTPATDAHGLRMEIWA
ncbi:MAG: DUF429 domain-containing protein [Acidobacteriota bacterium]